MHEIETETWNSVFKCAFPYLLQNLNREGLRDVKTSGLNPLHRMDVGSLSSIISAVDLTVDGNTTSSLLRPSALMWFDGTNRRDRKMIRSIDR